jgi:hypothetical protein
MKKSILILSILLFCSCEKQMPLKKPFVIVYKSMTCSSVTNVACYVAQDANGNRFDFNEKTEAYNIGDTIR